MSDMEFALIQDFTDFPKLVNNAILHASVVLLSNNRLSMTCCSSYDREDTIKMKVKSMQRTGSEATRNQIQPSKPKREIANVTNSQNTKRTYSQPSEQLFPKRWQTEIKIIWTR